LQRPWIALLVVAALGAAAGCIGGDDANPANATSDDDSAETLDATATNDTDVSAEPVDPDPDRSAAGNESEDGSGPTPTAYNFSIEDSVVDTRLEAGTFGATEGCVPASCPAETFELDNELPEGVPTVVEATLVHDGDTIESVDLDLEAPQGTAYDWSYASSFEGSATSFTYEETWRAIVVPAADTTVVAEVQPTTSITPPDDAAWNLTIETRALDTFTPANVPAEIPATESSIRVKPYAVDAANETVRLDQQASVHLVVWGPDDGLLAHVNQTGAFRLDLPAKAQEGPIVVMATGPEDRVVRFVASQPPKEPMRGLGWTLEYGDTHQAAPAQPAEWMTTVDRVPIRAGVFDEEGPGAWVEAQYDVQLSSPAGSLVDYQSTGSFSLAADVETTTLPFLWCPLGDESRVEGDYEGSYSSVRAGTQASAGTVLMHYER